MTGFALYPIVRFFMFNPLQAISQMPFRAMYGMARLRQEIVGLAQDFWKDGHWEREPDNLDGLDASPPDVTPPPVPQKNRPRDDLWHAMPGEISEKMWGALCVTPGDTNLTEQLIKPLGINKDMNILDLSAGLGSRLRKTADEFGAYIDGFEPDAGIAQRGMELSKASGHGKRVVIRHYDPMNLASPRSYDCVISRETIYRVADKEKFIQSIAACCKKKAQISFTDYVVDPECRDHPAIAAWMEVEKGANPPSLVEMAGLWAKAGFTLRVHDDQTDYYMKEVLRGLARFLAFINTVDPTPETQAAVRKRLKTWTYRLGAFQAGMKFYRFYAMR